MSCIDGFVTSVPLANRQKSIDYANQGDSVLIELGVMHVVELCRDDAAEGRPSAVGKAVPARDDERSSTFGANGPTRKRAMPA